MTHYDNLKVPWGAPPEVIDMAYKALMQNYHPDRNANSERSVRMTQIINASYHVCAIQLRDMHMTNGSKASWQNRSKVAEKTQKTRERWFCVVLYR